MISIIVDHTLVTSFSVEPLGVNSKRGSVRTFVGMYVHASPLTIFVYNSGSWWYIFLKSSEDIPGMFVDYFWMLTNFLYVCQSVSWLTSLLKLGLYRDISCSRWDIFLKFFRGIPKIFLDFFQIIQNFLYVCQSVSWLTSLLNLA